MGKLRTWNLQNSAAKRYWDWKDPHSPILPSPLKPVEEKWAWELPVFRPGVHILSFCKSSEEQNVVKVLNLCTNQTIEQLCSRHGKVRNSGRGTVPERSRFRRRQIQWDWIVSALSEDSYPTRSARSFVLPGKVGETSQPLIKIHHLPNIVLTCSGGVQNGVRQQNLR